MSAGSDRRPPAPTELAHFRLLYAYGSGGPPTLGSMSGTTYFSNERPEVAALVPADAARVLDVGCGAGTLGGSIRASGDRFVVGVEGDPQAARAAGMRLDEAHHLDLDDVLGIRAFAEANGESFDCMIAADVLEHLRDPWSVLAMLVSTVRPGGTVVASIPNVRALSVVLPLVVRGRFEYRDHGVLDRTHLRFFTRASATALLASAGLEVQRVERAPAPWRSGWKRRVGERLGDLGNEQFLFVARRPA